MSEHHSADLQRNNTHQSKEIRTGADQHKPHPAPLLFLKIVTNSKYDSEIGKKLSISL